MDREPPLSVANAKILTGIKRIKLRDAAKGDHIRSYAEDVPDGIVEGRDPKTHKLRLITSACQENTSLVLNTLYLLSMYLKSYMDGGTNEKVRGRGLTI